MGHRVNLFEEAESTVRGLGFVLAGTVVVAVILFWINRSPGPAPLPRYALVGCYFHDGLPPLVLNMERVSMAGVVSDARYSVRDNTNFGTFLSLPLEIHGNGTALTAVQTAQPRHFVSAFTRVGDREIPASNSLDPVARLSFRNRDTSAPVDFVRIPPETCAAWRPAQSTP